MYPIANYIRFNKTSLHMRKKLFSRVFLCCIGIFSLLSAALAQTKTISGTITDDKGIELAGPEFPQVVHPIGQLRDAVFVEFVDPPLCVCALAILMTGFDRN